MSQSGSNVSTLSTKKKAVLVVSVFLFVGLIAYVGQHYLSEWWFFVTMLGIAITGLLIFSFLQARNKKKDNDG